MQSSKGLERKTNLPVQKSKNNVDFDLSRDWGLIEASFIQDYGIKITQEYLGSISFGEFSNLLNGLTKDTALGQQLVLRAAKNDKNIQKATGKKTAELSVDWKDKKARDNFWILIRPRKK